MGGRPTCRGGVALRLSSPQGQYRTVLYDHWVKQLTRHKVPHTAEPTLIGTLGNPVKIRSWQVLTRGVGAGVTGLSQEPPASLRSSFLGLLRDASPEPARAQQEGVGRRGES